jgi:hypothetical protein
MCASWGSHRTHRSGRPSRSREHQDVEKPRAGFADQLSPEDSAMLRTLMDVDDPGRERLRSSARSRARRAARAPGAPTAERLLRAPSGA